MQVEADSEMLGVAFRTWPRKHRELATRLVDLFIIHGVDPGLARLKVTELFSPPRVTATMA